MSKEVTIYGFNSVETSVSKNPNSIIDLYVDKSSSNKRIEKLLTRKVASRLNIIRVDKSFLSEIFNISFFIIFLCFIIYFGNKKIRFPNVVVPGLRDFFKKMEFCFWVSLARRNLFLVSVTAGGGCIPIFSNSVP